MELYSLKMEEGSNLHDHINMFNQLVCQLMNADDKIKDEEQALLLLASLPKSYKPLVQMLLVGRTTLTVDEVTAALCESERMMRNDTNNTRGDHILVARERGLGRNSPRRHDDPKERSRSNVRRDLSDVECYYCRENGHMQVRCPQMREDLKKLNDMSQRKGDGDSHTNVVSDADDGDLYLAMGEEVAKSEWVMDSAASIHICRDRDLFDTLKIDGEFGHFNLANGEKLKVEGTGSVRMKLHNGASHILCNVRYVPTSNTNVISLGAMTLDGCKFFGTKKWCKVFKGTRLIMRGYKNEKNVCILDGRAVQRKSSGTTPKKVRFSKDVKVFGNMN
ncbi:unnamed protein product [Cuscuta campestris]|uniref:CCHC-type domain-containing protein n=1 Tax=Cuscuta campestris TaxID=132261 RepID=A0A484MC83_9ASTE|nr:unnamed protein product [Cuscuta campestris]